MIICFINGKLGLDVLRFILETSRFQSVIVVLNNTNKRKKDYRSSVKKITQEFANVHIEVMPWAEFNKDSDEKCVYRLGISVLFGHIIPKKIIEKFEVGIINLHPSLLPENRGASPIMWSILQGKPQGVTIHLIDEGLDTGPVLIQSKIKTSIDMNAGKIYNLCIQELFRLFVSNWELILNSKLLPIKQNQNDGSTHTVKSLDKLSIVEAHENSRIEDIIRRIQAFDQGKKRKLLFRENSGKTWKISIKLSEFKEEDLESK